MILLVFMEFRLIILDVSGKGYEPLRNVSIRDVSEVLRNLCNFISNIAAPIDSGMQATWT
jgi:hypothetical protein